MKNYFSYSFLLVLLFQSFACPGQLKFDIKSFNEKFDVVQWLCAYDNIAWWTTDSVLAAPEEEKRKLGQEWFCFQKDGVWHAAYGKYENGIFNAVFHYAVDSNNLVHRVYSGIDSNEANPYSRALIRTNELTRAIRDTTDVRLNRYIRREIDGTLSVWVLPAFSPAGEAVYGGEFYYRFDRNGNNLLEKNEYYQGNFRGFKTDKPREIWLDYKEMDKPSLGAIFFVWYYKKYFTRIFIENKKSRSTVFLDSNKQEYYWTHYEQ